MEFGISLINFTTPFIGLSKIMDTNHSKDLGNLPIVVCECGESILVIPDLKEMSRCITKHALFHAKKETDCKIAEAEYGRIEEQLTQKVILIIANGRFNR